MIYYRLKVEAMMKQANVDIHHEVSLKVFLPLEIRLNNWSPKKPLTKSAIGHSSRRLCLALQMRDEVKSRSPRKKSANISPAQQRTAFNATRHFRLHSTKLETNSFLAFRNILFIIVAHRTGEKRENFFFSSRSATANIQNGNFHKIDEGRNY